MKDGEAEPAKAQKKAVVADDAADAAPMLSGAKKEEVMGIFKQFDIKSDGKIPLSQLMDAKMKVGASEVKILKTLADMDFNGDGFVEASEWELYFATVSESLLDDELKVVLEDLRSAGSDMLTVYQCTLVAEGSSPETAGDTEAAAEAAAELQQSELQGEPKALVEALFKKWDFNGDGHIDRLKLQATDVEVGPRKAKVFANFEQMDVNDDKVVTLDEMLQYFGVAASLMDAAEFARTIEEMSELADAEKSIADMLELASEVAVMPTSSSEEQEDAEPPPELSPARRAMVEELFTTYSSDTATPIELASLTSVKVEVGPTKQSLLKGLQIMDANSDGMVEFSEMLYYFQFSGQTLDDSEFGVILGELKNAAVAIQNAKMAE